MFSPSLFDFPLSIPGCIPAYARDIGGKVGIHLGWDASSFQDILHTDFYTSPHLVHSSQSSLQFTYQHDFGNCKIAGEHRGLFSAWKGELWSEEAVMPEKNVKLAWKFET